MSTHITDVFNIDIPEKKLDFFDANLAYDSPVFIDPFLLQYSSEEKERELFHRMSDFFLKVYDVSLVARLSEKEIRELKSLVTFKEPTSVYMGYTAASNKGKGPSKHFADKLLAFFLDVTKSRYVKEAKAFPQGMYNPHNIRIFTDGLGPDGISDITVSLILDYLIKYTQIQANKLGIELTPNMPLNDRVFDYIENKWISGGLYDLPENPLKEGEPIVFVPKRLLRALDDDNDDLKQKVKYILKSDPELSLKFSSLIEKPLDDISIDAIRKALMTDESIHKAYFELTSEGRKPYNFAGDAHNLLALKTFDGSYDIKDLKSAGITAPQNEKEFIKLVEYLIEDFKDYFEDSTGWKDAWQDGSKAEKPKIEVDIGRIFWGKGTAIFGLFEEISFIPERGTNSGFLDFEIIWRNVRINIELKLLKNDSTSNKSSIPSYLHGLQVQLPKYIKKTKANHAYYITGQHFKNGNLKKTNHTYRANAIRKALPEVESQLKKDNKFKKLNYVNIDMTPKESASKS